MKVLFVSSGNSAFFEISPFIKSQGESLKRKGIDVSFYTIKGKGFKGYYSNVKKLKKFLSENTFDVVHAHYSLSGWVVLFTFTRLPKVLSLMGTDVHGGSKSIAGKLLGVQSFLIQFLFHKIIIKSENLRKFIIRKKNVYVIPNGVNFEYFKPKDKNEVRKTLNLPLDKKIVLFLGSTSDTNKNFSLAKEAMEKVKKKDILLLSPFPVTPDLIPNYLNACDALVFTSLNEGSPNVIKEALACNVNIVTTPSGDILERVQGVSNVWVSDFDAAEMAEKILIAIHNENKNSRKVVKNEIDERIIADKLIELY